MTRDSNGHAPQRSTLRCAHHRPGCHQRLHNNCSVTISRMPMPVVLCDGNGCSTSLAQHKSTTATHDHFPHSAPGAYRCANALIARMYTERPHGPTTRRERPPPSAIVRMAPAQRNNTTRKYTRMVHVTKQSQAVYLVDTSTRHEHCVWQCYRPGNPPTSSGCRVERKTVSTRRSRRPLLAQKRCVPSGHPNNSLILCGGRMCQQGNVR